MKRTILTIVAVFAGLGMVAAGSTAESSSEQAQTLTGTYKWVNADNPGSLRAEFTSTGKETWDVVFKFRFRGRPHTYAGTAEGSLSEGALEGTVKNENKRRTFAFAGEFEDGRFKGTHRELRDGEVYQTGWLALGEADSDS